MNTWKRPHFDLPAEASRERREEEFDDAVCNMAAIPVKELLARVVPGLNVHEARVIWESLADRRMGPTSRSTVNKTFFAWWNAISGEERNRNARRFGDIFASAMAQVYKEQVTP